MICALPFSPFSITYSTLFLILFPVDFQDPISQFKTPAVKTTISCPRRRVWAVRTATSHRKVKLVCIYFPLRPENYLMMFLTARRSFPISTRDFNVRQERYKPIVSIISYVVGPVPTFWLSDFLGSRPRGERKHSSLVCLSMFLGNGKKLCDQR